jgi:hypothetical protein
MSTTSTYIPTFDEEYTFQEALQKRLIINRRAHGDAMFRRYFIDGEGISRLPIAKQQALLLHGPRQKYRLEPTHSIPTLKTKDEVLVKVSLSRPANGEKEVH